MDATRYPLLLQNLLQHTPEELPDHYPLRELLEKMKHIVDLVNETTGKAVNIYQMKKIQKSIIPKTDPSVDLLDSSERVYIKEIGTTKLVKGKKILDCYLFLFSDCLLITKSSNEAIASRTKDKPWLLLLRKVRLQGNKSIYLSFLSLYVLLLLDGCSLSILYHIISIYLSYLILGSSIQIHVDEQEPTICELRIPNESTEVIQFPSKEITQLWTKTIDDVIKNVYKKDFKVRYSIWSTSPLFFSSIHPIRLLYYPHSPSTNYYYYIRRMDGHQGALVVPNWTCLPHLLPTLLLPLPLSLPLLHR